MLTPSLVDRLSFFYPLGNTPAVCLTQDLPCHEEAKILLLGCGDVRNVLFTTYSESASRSRRLDITCCDIQAAVIARNILLLTLLVDDTHGSNNGYIWDIYYHLYLDDKALGLVQSQARKLHTLSESVQSWHTSKYGKLLRFCNQDTLNRAREFWASYNTTGLTDDERKVYVERFKSDIRKAVDHKARLIGHGCILTGFRSAAPLGLQSLKDLPALFEHFWEHGTTQLDPESLSQAKRPNPMFASSLTDNYTLHYGTDPLLGFHLATAYAPLVLGSPLDPRSTGNASPQNVVEAARLQFRTWGSSFKRCAQNCLTLRFFSGEALAFCHTLQHRKLTGNSVSANWYRDPYHLDQLILDGEDYARTGDAPLLFNVIDTSNLMDHIGAINLLVATSPLLDCTISATLYTESLVKKEQNQKELIEGLLCGHFATISILLGLFPIEYWTNTTATSSVDEILFNASSHLMGSMPDKGQMYTRLAWKRPVPTPSGTSQTMVIPSILFDETDLVRILYEVYLKMFQRENVGNLLSKIDLLVLKNFSFARYHRGSLASFLCFVKRRVSVDWNQMMTGLLDLIENESDLMMGRNNIQELYLQLHLLGVYTVRSLLPSFSHNRDSQASKHLCAWNAMPEFVTITLKVPRAKLEVLTAHPLEKMGTPALHCILQSSPGYAGLPWHNIFAVLQLAFGEVTTLGSRSDDDFRVHVAEDRLGWKGSSPLLVSFCVPSWIIHLEGRATTIAFGVQTTPHSIQVFLKPLGMEMNVYKTNLGNQEDVYITKNRPRQTGNAFVCNFAGFGGTGQRTANQAVTTTLKANVDHVTARIVEMAGRVNVLDGETRSALRDGAAVETIQISPCIIAVVIGKSSRQYRLHFPAPVLRSRSKARTARKSSYVEVVAPICGPLDDEGFPDFMYPLFINRHEPVIWNMPRLNLESLPILNTAKKQDMEWLITHSSLMFSSRERKMREATVTSFAETHNNVRVDLKDSLFSMFMHFSGLQGQQASIFGIHNPTGGGVHMIFFVSCLRLDVANHTVVLDAAVLPLTKWLLPRIHPFLAALTRSLRLCNITVDDKELGLWKQIIPALVERCRQWEHRPSCQYLKKSQIPLSVENGQNPICSCGDGKLPSDFGTGIPEWDTVSKYAVRAAISPSFSVPFVELCEAEIATAATLPAPDGGGDDGDDDDNRCKTCAKKASSPGTTKILKCGRCHTVRYCSVACQRADWKDHKKVCTSGS